MQKREETAGAKPSSAEEKARARYQVELLPMAPVTHANRRHMAVYTGSHGGKLSRSKTELPNGDFSFPIETGCNVSSEE